MPSLNFDSSQAEVCDVVDEIKAAREKALSEIQCVLKKDTKRLRDDVRAFDSSKGCLGAHICVGSVPFARANQRRLCEYAMHAIVIKMSAGKDSAVKPIAKINMSVENFLESAVCFISRIEREIAIVSGEDHKSCTPFRSILPSQSILKTKTSREWSNKNAEAFKTQARVSGLDKGGGNDDEKDRVPIEWFCDGYKRSRDEFEAAASE